MVRAVVFDIGGVLEITPATGWQQRWCTRLGLPDEQFRTLLAPPGRAGSLGQIDLEQYTATAQELLGLDDEQAVAFMDDIWDEYRGHPTPNSSGTSPVSETERAPGSCRTASSAHGSASRSATGSKTAAMRSPTPTRSGS
jgi:hypothetical protein